MSAAALPVPVSRAFETRLPKLRARVLTRVGRSIMAPKLVGQRQLVIQSVADVPNYLLALKNDIKVCSCSSVPVPVPLCLCLSLSLSCVCA